MLARAAVRHEVLAYPTGGHTSTYGLDAAAALGVDPARVFKTLLVSVDDRLVVALVPVNRSLDLKALARSAGGKRAALADAPTAERVTGYVVGGISPFGQRGRHPTFVDDSVTMFDRIFVSGGRRGLEIALAPDDLVRLTDACVAPLAARA